MTVLLTGGAGYIGSHTALSILNSGKEVVVLDNLSNASPEALTRVEQLTGKKAPLVVGDCANRSFISPASRRWASPWPSRSCITGTTWTRR